MIAYIVYLLGSLYCRLLPESIRVFSAELLALMVRAVQYRRREIVKRNIDIITRSKLDRKSVVFLSRRVYTRFGTVISEFLAMSSGRKQKFSNISKVTISGQEILDEKLREGRGILLISAHMGNWELGGAVLSEAGYSVAAVSGTHSSSKVNEFFNKRRNENNIVVIPTYEFREKAVEVLDRNMILAVLADRTASGLGRETSMFGYRARLPVLPFFLAVETGTPVIPAFMHKSDSGYEIDIMQPFDSDSSVEELHEEWASILEKEIESHPGEWMMFDEIFFRKVVD